MPSQTKKTSIPGKSTKKNTAPSTSTKTPPPPSLAGSDASTLSSDTSQQTPTPQHAVNQVYDVNVGDNPPPRRLTLANLQVHSAVTYGGCYSPLGEYVNDSSTWRTDRIKLGVSKSKHRQHV